VGYSFVDNSDLTSRPLAPKNEFWRLWARAIRRPAMPNSEQRRSQGISIGGIDIIGVSCQRLPETVGTHFHIRGSAQHDTHWSIKYWRVQASCVFNK
jgi:hypothetical protein